MQQQINLYQPISTAKEEQFSARTMLILFAITLLFMMMFYGFLLFKKMGLEDENAALNQKNQQTQALVEKLEMTVNKLTDTKKERRKLEHLKKVYASKEFALQEISSMVKGNHFGLSSFFSALARRNIEAIWFEKIDVYQGGQQVTLKGQTTDERYIPDFTASLAEESAFNGINFKRFNATRNEQGDQVQFNLQTEIKQKPN
jgi:Tfp pilus assembly protein PilN